MGVLWGQPKKGTEKATGWGLAGWDGSAAQSISTSCIGSSLPLSPCPLPPQCHQSHPTSKRCHVGKGFKKPLDGVKKLRRRMCASAQPQHSLASLSGHRHELKRQVTALGWTLTVGSTPSPSVPPVFVQTPSLLSQKAQTRQPPALNASSPQVMG